MSLQVEKLDGNMAKLTIEVAAEDLEKAIENAYQKSKNKISIPGFRKGKAPRKPTPAGARLSGASSTASG